MKRNIGSKLCLYPTPVGVIGTKVDSRINYVLVAHFGIVSHQHVLVSLSKSHYTNKGILESKKLTINLVDKDMLPKADYVGSVSGARSTNRMSFLPMKVRRGCQSSRNRRCPWNVKSSMTMKSQDLTISFAQSKLFMSKKNT